MKNKEAVIVLNGPDFDRTGLLNIIRSGNGSVFTAAADGGIRHLSGLGIRIDLHAGDFDSADENSGSAHASETMKFPRQKDESDFSLCLQSVIDRGYRNISVFGATGGRSDHFISNFHSAVNVSSKGAEIVFRGTDENIYFLNGPKEFSLDRGTTVSIFAGTEKVSGVTLEGFEYNVSGTDFFSSVPLGLSNMTAQNVQKITFHSGVLAVFVNTRPADNEEGRNG